MTPFVTEEQVDMEREGECRDGAGFVGDAAAAEVDGAALASSSSMSERSIKFKVSVTVFGAGCSLATALVRTLLGGVAADFEGDAMIAGGLN